MQTSKPRSEPKSSPPSKPLALIDGDILVYQTCAGFEAEATEASDGLWESIVAGLEDRLKKWTLDSGCTEAVICLSHTKNFRKEVYPPYKAHRDGKPRPHYLKEARAYLEDKYECWCVEWLEADDLMGIGATTPGLNAVIVSIDKDLQQIPATVFRPGKDIKPLTISPGEAEMELYLQWVRGDSVDNLPGVRGVGEKRAAQWWGDIPPGMDPMEAAIQLYQSKGIPWVDAMAQYDCIRILRHGDRHPITNQYLSLEGLGLCTACESCGPADAE